jgi:diguanylate cyclase (GGDEF)-like protein
MPLSGQPGSLADTRLLVDLSCDVTSTLDLQAVLDRSFASLRRLVDFGGGAIQMIDDGHLIAMATEPPASAEALSVRIPVGAGVSGKIAETGEPIYIADIATDERVHPEGRKKGVSGGVRSYFGAPLIIGGVPIGVVQVDSPEIDAFSERERGMVLAFLPTIAAAVQNAQLYLREREAIDRLEEVRTLQDHLTQHDPLTGLPNRTALDERLAAAAPPYSLLLVDLDRFRDANHVLGPQNGDLLLVEAGRRIASVLGDGDWLCRLGGDVFTIVAVSDPRMLATTVIAAFEAPFRAAGITLELGVTIGWASCPQDAQHAGVLLQRADSALDHAKDAQTGAEAYAPEADRFDPGRLALLGGLRAAMAAGEVGLAFQPLIDLRTGALRHVEALVRWQHPVHGMLPPAAWVAAVERTSLIKPLTSHVLAAALAQLAVWRADGLDLGVAVNVSARNLHDAAFVSEVAEALDASGIPPEQLTLELTESAVMADPEACLGTLEQLANAGVRLAVDDFGTGHSSMAYLSRLPVHEIKVDRSFVAGMAGDGPEETIVRATIELGRALGLEVVAEGIEDGDTLTRLAELGCDLGQGFHIARPMPGAALPDWARAVRPRT